MTIGQYSVIYADPPWRYTQKGLQGAAEKHYPTMGIDEICALPVADLAAPDSVLFLWATFPQLPEALRLIKAWDTGTPETAGGKCPPIYYCPDPGAQPKAGRGP